MPAETLKVNHPSVFDKLSQSKLFRVHWCQTKDAQKLYTVQRLAFRSTQPLHSSCELWTDPNSAHWGSLTTIRCFETWHNSLHNFPLQSSAQGLCHHSTVLSLSTLWTFNLQFRPSSSCWDGTCLHALRLQDFWPHFSQLNRSERFGKWWNFLMLQNKGQGAYIMEKVTGIP